MVDDVVVEVGVSEHKRL